MKIPWRYREDSVKIPWRYREDTVKIPWRFREDTVKIPRRYSEDTAPARYLHGIFKCIREFWVLSYKWRRRRPKNRGPPGDFEIFLHMKDGSIKRRILAKSMDFYTKSAAKVAEVLWSLWECHQSKDMDFLHRCYEQKYFSVPKKYFFSRPNSKNIFCREFLDFSKVSYSKLQ